MKPKNTFYTFVALPKEWRQGVKIAAIIAKRFTNVKNA